MWRYFQDGEEETIPFGPIEFPCEVRKVLPYNKTNKRVQQGDKILKKKKQKKIFDFFFCAEYSCNTMFSSQLHLDQHRLPGAHDSSNRSTTMDNVKHSFAENIKQSSHFLTNPVHSNPITTNEKGVTQTLVLLKKRLGSLQKDKILLFKKTDVVYGLNVVMD